MKRLITTICLCALFVAGTVLADWNPGEPYKMHYPQLPDPFGWDVHIPAAVPANPMADDWLCTQNGPVTDIHFWGSWKNDFEGTIDNIRVEIYDNIPAGGEYNYSQPGERLWFQWFGQDDFTIRPYGQGEQGWYNPSIGEVIRPDHSNFHQINIENILDNQFIQEEGEIYWLGISVVLEDIPGSNAFWGWKTSLDHWSDDAVYYGQLPTGGWTWLELRDPLTQQSLDMAFVITPEPTTVALLGLGSLVLLRKRRA